MNSPPGHAIIFAATGLLGWSVLNEICSNYPVRGTFSKVTAVINRPVSEKDLCLPDEASGRPKLQVVPGVNLFDIPQHGLIDVLKEKVSDVSSITHAFYFVFKAHNDDFTKECEMNCDIMRRVSGALNVLSPSLESFVYSGGTRGYGIYVPGGTFEPPLKEDLAYQLPEDYAKTVAYPWFRKILTEASRGRDWTWSEVCPDAVIGFSPNGSGYSLALHWGQYLSLYAHNHGVTTRSVHMDEPVEVSFPGIDAALRSTFSPISSRILGRVSIYAALHPDKCGQKVINMADTDMLATYEELWPKIAAWFGLRGVGPSSDADALKPSEYIAKYQHVFRDKNCLKALTCGVGAGAKQLDSVGWWLTFDRELDLTRLRSVGFEERRDPAEGWFEAFEQLRDAGILL